LKFTPHCIAQLPKLVLTMQFLRQATRLAPRLAPQLKPTVSVGSKRYIQGIFDKPSFEQLFENNRKWVAEQKKNDPDYFKNLAKGQSPKYLFIGCADSRIPAQEVLGLKCGELFVHRNVANLVVNGDMNLLAVLQYSVEVLKVEDIIVCGHYECGGIKAACANHDHGLVEHWLRNIRDINRLHAEELEAIECEDARHRRLVELNVQEQCINLYANPIVQKAQLATSLPRIHGFVYDIAEGLVKELPIDFKAEISKIKQHYSLYNFKADA